MALSVAPILRLVRWLSTSLQRPHSLPLLLPSSGSACPGPPGNLLCVPAGLGHQQFCYVVRLQLGPGCRGTDTPEAPLCLLEGEGLGVPCHAPLLHQGEGDAGGLPQATFPGEVTLLKQRITPLAQTAAPG